MATIMCVSLGYESLAHTDGFSDHKPSDRLREGVDKRRLVSAPL